MKVARLLLLAAVLALAPRGASAAPSSYVVAAPGVTDVVVSGGYAYGARPWANRVEVVNLGTGRLEAPIPVGGEPIAIDLSPDGARLYTANYAGRDVSVVDLASRREVGRIALPSQPSGRPMDIAVAANNNALVIRQADLSGGPKVTQVDLATGAIRERFWETERNETTFMQASGDRSRIGMVRSGMVTFYDTATDDILPPRYLGHAAHGVVAVDRTGSRLLAGRETFLVDGGLVLRGTVPDAGVTAVGLNAPGNLGFRLRDGHVEVFDVARSLVTATIPIPGSPRAGQALAVSPDGGTIVAAVESGLAVLPVATAQPAGCPAPVTPTGVVAFCGGLLADVVVDGGRAYASNPARNQIEVVSLAGRTAGPPILVGSRPTNLDLSADGRTLYVVNAGSDEISVVDLVSGREARRIVVPVTAQHPGRPRAIAVAADGTAFVTTGSLTTAGTERLLRVNLSTGAVTDQTTRNDVPAMVASSGDKSRVLLAAAKLSIFEVGTGTFGPSRDVGGGFADIVVDRTGSAVLLQPAPSEYPRGTVLLDRDLTRRATIPDLGYGVAVNAAGTAGYRAQAYDLQVLDLARGLAARSVRLPEPVPRPDSTASGKVAVTADGATAAVLTRSGVSVVAVGGATPIPCPLPPVAPGVTAVCGAPLAEMVAGETSAFVSNPYANTVEVVSLATGAREASIPVGSRPRGLDLSPDGRSLYVANSGAEEVSVVDVGARREVRRITVPSHGSNDRPFSIAVGDRGKALVTTTYDGSGYGAYLLELDLATGASSIRTDYTSDGRVPDDSIVRASGDHSRIFVVLSGSAGEVARYDTATDSFAARGDAGGYIAYAATDAQGHRLLAGPYGDVVDGDLRPVSALPPGGKGVAVHPGGRRGYRVQDRAVEVLDLDAGAVVDTIPLPEEVAYSTGSTALGAGGTRLAVATFRGVSVVPTDTAPSTTWSVWSSPAGAPGVDGLGTWVGIADAPGGSYLFGMHVGFTATSQFGFVGLAGPPGARYAVFSLDGHARSARLEWSPGRFYFLYVWRTAPDEWAAAVYDASAGAWVVLAPVKVGPGWGALAPGAITTASWYGARAPSCAGYPRADVFFYAPSGTTLTGTGRTAADCPAEATDAGNGWSRHRMGA
ncbi:MAG: YncE family protein [Acidimicrobiia bacterium]